MRPVRQCRARRPACFLILALALAACSSPPVDSPRLRIANSGARAIENLTVLFPLDEIEFGDVPAGFTSSYRHVPEGVYRYAAYRFSVNGDEMIQPVIDFVGEEAMAGENYTYVLELVPDRASRLRIELVEVRPEE